MIAGCATQNTASVTPLGGQKSSLMPRPVATLTQVQPTPIATLTASPVTPLPEVNVAWEALAGQLRLKAQQAKSGNEWENLVLKEEAYKICNNMINISVGQQRVDSKEILKRWRWGMELMNPGQLDEVIRLIDQYN